MNDGCGKILVITVIAVMLFFSARFEMEKKDKIILAMQDAVQIASREAREIQKIASEAESSNSKEMLEALAEIQTRALKIEDRLFIFEEP